MPPEVTIDTSVLVRANIQLTPERAAARRQAARLALLRRVRAGEATVLISRQLAAEYSRQLAAHRNEFIRLFFELLTRPDGSHVIVNWRNPWRHSDRVRWHGCGFPPEDEHVLRTAVRDDRTTIYSEEDRMLRAHPCIRHEFDVVISAP